MLLRYVHRSAGRQACNAEREERWRHGGGSFNSGVARQLHSTVILKSAGQRTDRGYKLSECAPLGLQFVSTGSFVDWQGKKKRNHQKTPHPSSENIQNGEFRNQHSFPASKSSKSLQKTAISALSFARWAFSNDCSHESLGKESHFWGHLSALLFVSDKKFRST